MNSTTLGYAHVRQLIKSKTPVTLEDMKMLYIFHGIKEKPYVRKHVCATRYFDSQFPNVHYEFNTISGEFRRRRIRRYKSFTSSYTTVLNPQKTEKRGERKYRPYQTKEFVSNLPKQMLYALSRILAYRTNYWKLNLG